MKIAIQIILLAAVVTVVTSQSHGDLCDSHADCNSSANLYCLAKNCECRPGFLVNRSKECKKSYGETCEHILDCNIDKTLTCDPATSRCACQKPDEQIFDIGLRKACVSLLGFSCAHMPSEFSLQCVQGAYCDMPIVNGSMIHRCECMEGWEATDNLTCRRL